LSLATIIDDLTSRTGLIAALVVVVGLLLAVQNLVRPYLVARKEAKAARPRLFVSPPLISELAEYGRVRELRFEVGNAGKGTALMRSLRLRVSELGVSEEVRETVTAAPVAVHAHRVEMRPDKLEYDVRGRTFAPEQPPLSFGEGEADAFVVKVVSREPYWFRARIEAEWVDLANPEEVMSTVTEEHLLEFPAEVRRSPAQPNREG
jgi:hypothetical protein